MEREFRRDHGELREPVRTPEGFLRVEGFVARPGIYEYVNTPKDEAKGYGKAGTIRRELRPEEETFRDDVLTGYEGAPVTANHPSSTEGVTPKNVRAFEVGAAGRARRVGNRLAASMLIKDPKVISRVESRELNQLSPGYTSMIYKTPGADRRYAYAGNPDGKYDTVQRDIQINHLALCKAARGGADLEIRMDGFDDCSIGVCAGQLEPTVFTTSVEGHQHSLDPTALGGTTSYAQIEGQDMPHAHEWVRGADGVIQIADNAGHTHGVDNASVGLREDSIQSRTPDVHIAHGGAMSQKNEMTPEEQIRALKAQLEGVTKERDQRQDALSTAEAARDGALAKLTTLGERVTALETQLAAGATAMETKAIAEQASRADSAEAELAKLKLSREADIRKAAEVRVKAVTIMGPEFRVDGMNERAIQATVIKKYAPKEDTSDAVSNAYLEARFDSIFEERMKTARSFTRVGEVLAGGQVREVRVDSADKRGPDLSTREGRAKAWHEQAINPSKEA